MVEKIVFQLFTVFIVHYHPDEKMSSVGHPLGKALENPGKHALFEHPKEPI